jgi:heme/copper-type cytochrome/quinol oxidase subunit 3
MPDDVKDGHYYLPNAPTGWRETIVTHPLTAAPQWLLRLPMPGWAPLIAAWFTAAFFMLLTVKLVAAAFVCGALAIGALLHWGWALDPKPLAEPVDIGGGIRLPAYMSGPSSQSWWAMVVLMLVAGAMYACVLFTYLYLWTVSPGLWPPPDALPALWRPAAVALLLLSSSAAIGIAGRRLAAGGSVAWGIAAAVVLFVSAFVLDAASHAQLAPSSSAYAAAVYLVLSFEGFFGVVVITLALFALARHFAGRLDAQRRVTFDNARLYWHYTVAQSLLGLALVHGFARALG